MFSLLGLIVLGFGFVVLVATFVWMTRLLSICAQQKRLEAIASREEPGKRQREEEARMQGRGYGANYGLLLGFLACLLFWISPLMLALSVGGLFYSGRAVWQGARYLRKVILRALAGLVLSASSVGLHFLKATGGLPDRLF